ncbi:MAG: GNAT family N-acetyltransferase [Thaumarchaeota archaeon]|nr:GNAT family N-acetyltransferase [Nitrososphaerota archaeon]
MRRSSKSNRGRARPKPPPGFKVRLANKDDIGALVNQRHMMFEAMRHPTQGEHRRGDRAYRNWAVEKIEKGLLRCYLVEGPKGKVAAGGCVWLREHPPRPSRFGRLQPYLMSMYTEPEFRRLGLATVIVDRAVRWASARGYRRATLHASEEGRKLYSKLGWVRAWEMRLDLKKSSGATAGRARSSRRAV